MKRTLANLRERLREAEATIDAIRMGHVDALVVQGPTGEQIFTLKGTDHRYRQLVETMNEAALLLDEQGTIVYCNASFATLARCPLEKTIGTSFQNFIPPSMKATAEALLRRQGGGSSKAEVDLLTRDGSRIPVYVSVTDGWDEEERLICVIATDLREQKRTRESVAAEHLAALIVDQAAEGIVVCDPTGRVIRASRAAVQAADENPLFQLFENAFRLEAESGTPISRSVREAALKGDTLSGQEVTLRGRNQTRGLLLSAGPILSDRGEPIGCVVSFVDITDRRRIAEERQALLDSANTARLEAEAASRSKDEFLAMLGHELRNPLAPIMTALDIMRLRDDPGQRRERQIIERHVKHVVTLVGDLLDVSRITRGAVELDRHPIDIKHVIARAVELASPAIDERRHRLTIDVGENLMVNADEARMAQVFANLLTNAAKYTPPGGNIGVWAGETGKDVVVKVIDDGIGIADELLPHVFESFVQGKRSVERSEGGLGLGLAIVRSLVSLHDGKVSVRSVATKGSEFKVRLPACARSSAATVAASPAVIPVPSGGAQRVLVVDDNVDAADLLAETLHDFGHETRVAYDGPSALSMAADFLPHVGVLDIGLPVMDGFELARTLRTNPSLGPALRLIALTGYGQESDRRRSAEAGFDRHLVKPIDGAAIDALIREWSIREG